MRILAATLVVACSSSEKPRDLPQLEVSIEGKRLAVDRAFLRHLSPDVFAVVLGAGKGSCTEDGDIGFTFAKRLAATGHESHVITDLYSREHDFGRVEPVKVTLVGTKLGLPQGVMGKLVMRGEVDLVDCPDAPPSGLGTPKVTHPAKARIIVAGKPLDVKGVTVQTRPGKAATDLPNIVISTNVKDCSSVTLPAPVILERRDGRWLLHGTWFAAEHTTEQPTELAFNANNVGTSADGPTLELQLSGSGKLGDYTVKLEGTAEAIECVR